MKKAFALLAAAGSSVAAFAEGSSTATTQYVENIVGSSGVLNTVKDYIVDVATNANLWTIIGTIVGVGLMIWLGRAMIRAVRAYFSTAM